MLEAQETLTPLLQTNSCLCPRGRNHIIAMLFT